MTKKAQKFTLELEDEMPMYDDMAFLFFHTATPGYLFADDLNRLYRMALARRDDLEMRGHRWPLYTYSDPITKMTYHLVERPAGSGGLAMHWKEGHKMMVIQGEESERRAKRIRSDFESTPLKKAMPTMVDEERARILETYQSELMPVSQYIPTEEPATALPRKAARGRAELDALVQDVVDCLDYLGS